VVIVHGKLRGEKSFDEEVKEGKRRERETGSTRTTNSSLSN